MSIHILFIYLKREESKKRKKKKEGFYIYVLKERKRGFQNEKSKVK
jgi:hypothetical protein